MAAFPPPVGPTIGPGRQRELSIGERLAKALFGEDAFNDYLTRVEKDEAARRQISREAEIGFDKPLPGGSPEAATPADAVTGLFLSIGGLAGTPTLTKSYGKFLEEMQPGPRLAGSSSTRDVPKAPAVPSEPVVPDVPASPSRRGFLRLLPAAAGAVAKAAEPSVPAPPVPTEPSTLAKRLLGPSAGLSESDKDMLSHLLDIQSEKGDMSETLRLLEGYGSLGPEDKIRAASEFWTAGGLPETPEQSAVFISTLADALKNDPKTLSEVLKAVPSVFPSSHVAAIPDVLEEDDPVVSALFPSLAKPASTATIPVPEPAKPPLELKLPEPPPTPEAISEAVEPVVPGVSRRDFLKRAPAAAGAVAKLGAPPEVPEEGAAPGTFLERFLDSRMTPDDESLMDSFATLAETYENLGAGLDMIPGYRDLEPGAKLLVAQRVWNDDLSYAPSLGAFVTQLVGANADDIPALKEMLSELVYSGDQEGIAAIRDQLKYLDDVPMGTDADFLSWKEAFPKEIRSALPTKVSDFVRKVFDTYRKDPSKVSSLFEKFAKTADEYDRLGARDQIDWIVKHGVVTGVDPALGITKETVEGIKALNVPNLLRLPDVTPRFEPAPTTPSAEPPATAPAAPAAPETPTDPYDTMISNAEAQLQALPEGSASRPHLERLIGQMREAQSAERALAAPTAVAPPVPAEPVPPEPVPPIVPKVEAAPVPAKVEPTAAPVVPKVESEVLPAEGVSRRDFLRKGPAAVGAAAQLSGLSPAATSALGPEGQTMLSDARAYLSRLKGVRDALAAAGVTSKLSGKYNVESFSPGKMTPEQILAISRSVVEDEAGEADMENIVFDLNQVAKFIGDPKAAAELRAVAKDIGQLSTALDNSPELRAMWHVRANTRLASSAVDTLERLQATQEGRDLLTKLTSDDWSEVNWHKALAKFGLPDTTSPYDLHLAMKMAPMDLAAVSSPELASRISNFQSLLKQGAGAVGQIGQPEVSMPKTEAVPEAAKVEAPSATPAVPPSEVEAPTTVPISAEDQGFTYHSTDSAEKLEGILKEGLRSGHVSNVRGQGVDGPYVLVYGKQTGLTDVPHRPGDYMGQVRGTPKAIIVDPEAFVTRMPIPEMEARLKEISDRIDALGTKMTTDHLTPDEVGELNRLERVGNDLTNRYLEALDKEDEGGYHPMDPDAYFSEAEALGKQYGIPVIRGTMDEDGVLQIPKGALAGLPERKAANVPAMAPPAAPKSSGTGSGKTGLTAADIDAALGHPETGPAYRGVLDQIMAGRNVHDVTAQDIRDFFPREEDAPVRAVLHRLLGTVKKAAPKKEQSAPSKKGIFGPDETPEQKELRMRAFNDILDAIPSLLVDLMTEITPEIQKTLPDLVDQGMPAIELTTRMGPSEYFPKEHRLELTVNDFMQDPDVLLHEIAHSLASHDFPAMAPERPEIGKSIPLEKKSPAPTSLQGLLDLIRGLGMEEPSSEQGPVVPERAYAPIGEGKFAEVDPDVDFHFEENLGKRAAYSAEEHRFMTAYESLKNNPAIRDAVDRAYDAIITVVQQRMEALRKGDSLIRGGKKKKKPEGDEYSAPSGAEEFERDVRRAMNVQKYGPIIDEKIARLVDKLTPIVKKVLPATESADFKVADVELSPFGKSHYDPQSDTLHIGLWDFLENPSVIPHELAHSMASHSFPGVAPDPLLPEKELDKIGTDPGDVIDALLRGGNPPRPPKEEELKAYAPLSGGKVAEVPPSLRRHTSSALAERAKYSTEEHLFQTSYDVLRRNPEVLDLLDAAYKEITDIVDGRVVPRRGPYDLGEKLLKGGKGRKETSSFRDEGPEDYSKIDRMIDEVLGKVEMPEDVNPRTGRPFIRSEETREKLAAGRRGHVASAEELAKRSAAQKGRPKTEEFKEKVSITKTGVPRGPFTEEHRKAMSEAQKSRRAEERERGEVRRPGAGYPKGRPRAPFSEETKRKMSESRKAFVERLRKAREGKTEE